MAPLSKRKERKMTFAESHTVHSAVPVRPEAWSLSILRPSLEVGITTPVLQKKTLLSRERS